MSDESQKDSRNPVSIGRGLHTYGSKMLSSLCAHFRAGGYESFGTDRTPESHEARSRSSLAGILRIRTLTQRRDVTLATPSTTSRLHTTGFPSLARLGRCPCTECNEYTADGGQGLNSFCIPLGNRGVAHAVQMVLSFDIHGREFCGCGACALLEVSLCNASGDAATLSCVTRQEHVFVVVLQFSAARLANNAARSVLEPQEIGTSPGRLSLEYCSFQTAVIH